MKKNFFASLIAGLTLVSSVQARQIIDKTNNFFINLPDRFLLEANANTENKYVVLNAYDPDDEATFIVKISPAQVSEIRGMALDNERSKFRNSLMKMGLEPYVEGILHMAPSHEAIYTFSKLDDQGEVLNYLMAKFWAHNKEFSFFCIQPTKTLKTQEFIDSIDSFICLRHNNYTIPLPQKKERPEYDKAKEKHDILVKKANLEAKKLLTEGKDEEAKKLLEAVPKFEEKPVEYIPLVEINGLKPLPANITDKVAHDVLYSEHPEQVLAKARKYTSNVTKQDPVQEENPQIEEIVQTEKNTQETDDKTPDKETKAYVNPPPIQKNEQGVIIIRDGKATRDYDFKPEPQRKLTKEEIKQMEKMKKEQEKFEKEQEKRQAKLDKLRKKELEKARKTKNKD